MSAAAGSGCSDQAHRSGGHAWAAPVAVAVDAPAKLTLSLRVVGVRPDGYHLIDAEMVTLDLADALLIADGDGLDVVDATGMPQGGSIALEELGDDNLVRRALVAAGRRAHVVLTKRIPAAAGLGGGSADAAAILRWAGCSDAGVALRLGADVPFCVAGGRARVSGIGEVVEALPYEERHFVLLSPPFPVSTAAVFAAWDEAAAGGDGSAARGDSVNDLERAALGVEPRLGAYRDRLWALTGRRPRLAGSGGTWFVEGGIEPAALAEAGTRARARQGLLVEAATVPATTLRPHPA